MDAAVLQFFGSIRCPVLDAFFQAVTALGEETVVAAVVALVYLCFSRRTGEQALLTVLTASCLATCVKGAVRRVRPFAAGTVTRVETDGFLVSTMDLDADMSFPSGHATATGAFLSALSPRTRKTAVCILSVLAALLVGCSRLYLGVHYPSDVLTGLALGFLCALVWQIVYTRFYGARLYLFALFALLMLLPLLFTRTATDSMFRIAALAAGTAAGLLFEDAAARLPEAHGWKMRVLRLFVTALCAAAVFVPLHFLLPDLPACTFAQYALAVFAAVGPAALLLKKLRL